MDDRKFLFVTCVNNEELYQNRCLTHIQELSIPEDYSVELLPIYHASGMAEGYNRALEVDAKYKIYLHQDTFISNKNLLFDLLNLFQTNPSLGLLGVVGTKVRPSNGVWWEGSGFVGRLFGCRDGVTLSDVYFGSVTGDFESVQAIDGLFMATQYDLPWRDDLFSGFHFYDASQAVEFIRKGYVVGVPAQREPWCIHIGKDVKAQIQSEEFQKNMRVFQEYYDLTVTD